MIQRITSIMLAICLFFMALESRMWWKLARQFQELQGIVKIQNSTISKIQDQEEEFLKMIDSHSRSIIKLADATTDLAKIVGRR